jgi:hypothetical protein
MTEEAKKTKLELVEPTTEPKPKPDNGSSDTDPTSVFEDLAALRKETRITVTKREMLTTVVVDRPASDCYFRVNPDPETMLEATVYKLKDGPDRATYYVLPSMRDHPLLIDRIRWVLLVCTYVWPKRQIGIWPVVIDTGRGNPWWISAPGLPIRQRRRNGCRWRLAPTCIRCQ